MQHQLDHEKLDVYQIELQFVAWSTDLMVELCNSVASKTRRIAETCDHLVRVVSMLSKLVDRFSPVTQVREDRVRYAIEDEHDGRESPSV